MNVDYDKIHEINKGCILTNLIYSDQTECFDIYNSDKTLEIIILNIPPKVS